MASEPLTQEQMARVVDDAKQGLDRLMLSGVAIRPHIASRYAGNAYQAIDALAAALTAVTAERDRLREALDDIVVLPNYDDLEEAKIIARVALAAGQEGDRG